MGTRDTLARVRGAGRPSAAPPPRPPLLRPPSYPCCFPDPPAAPVCPAGLARNPPEAPEKVSRQTLTYTSSPWPRRACSPRPHGHEGHLGAGEWPRLAFGCPQPSTPSPTPALVQYLAALQSPPPRQFAPRDWRGIPLRPRKGKSANSDLHSPPWPRRACSPQPHGHEGAPWRGWVAPAGLRLPPPSSPSPTPALVPCGSPDPPAAPVSPAGLALDPP